MTIQEKFRQVYADAIGMEKFASDGPEWRDAYKKRSLDWKASEPITLESAADLYDLIESYNAFNDDGRKMIGELAGAFEGEGITVTPAREGSVCIYLHVAADDLRESVEQFIRQHLKADEIDWDGNDLRVWWD